MIILSRYKRNKRFNPYKTNYSFSIYPQIKVSQDDWLKAGTKLTVEIKDVDDRGIGIAHVKGVKILVPRTSIGDKVRIVIKRVKGDFGYAKVVEWLS